MLVMAKYCISVLIVIQSLCNGYALRLCMCELKITQRARQLARIVTLSTLILSGMRNYSDVSGVTRSQKMQHLPQFCSQEYVIINDVCMPSSDLYNANFRSTKAPLPPPAPPSNILRYTAYSLRRINLRYRMPRYRL